MHHSPEVTLFKTQNLYQNDDKWKNTKLGNSSETIGGWGCLLTSVTMMLNGMGYNETPETVNDKMKAAGGFQGAFFIPSVGPAASYKEGSLRELPSTWRRRGFVRRGDRYYLRPRFRRLVTVVEQDVRDPAPDGPFDLILCRNLAFTYFDAGLQRQVARNLANGLRNGGALVVGPTRSSPTKRVASCRGARARASTADPPDELR